MVPLLSTDAGQYPGEALQALAFSLPEGTRELLPLLDFLEAFPSQQSEEDLVHLVGDAALAIAKSERGGIWNGERWVFLRGAPPPESVLPKDSDSIYFSGAPSLSQATLIAPSWKTWLCLPWVYAQQNFGHLVIMAPSASPALMLLVSISAPFIAWRRMEARQEEQKRAMTQQLSRMSTLFRLTQSLSDASITRRSQLVKQVADCIAVEFLVSRLLILDPAGNVIFQKGMSHLPPSLSKEELRKVRKVHKLCHALELRDKKRRNGFAYAAEPAKGRLQTEDKLFLHTLLSIASTQLSSLELREAQLQKIRMEKDLELARAIQRQILPKRLPEPPGWSCTGANLPFEAVGGDLFDLWLTEDGLCSGGCQNEPFLMETECNAAVAPEGNPDYRVHLAVGDISGKGLPACMMMTQLSAFLRSTADRRVNNWGELAMRLNKRMNEVREGHRFATLFAGSLNPATGDLRYVNAGHNPPILLPVGGGPVQELTSTGPMAGLFWDAKFGEGHATMHPGDILLIFTDGLVDAENPSGKPLGERALVEVVQKNQDKSTDDIFESLVTAAFKHMEGSGFRDDVTLMLIKRKAAQRGTELQLNMSCLAAPR